MMRTAQSMRRLVSTKARWSSTHPRSAASPFFVTQRWQSTQGADASATSPSPPSLNSKMLERGFRHATPNFNVAELSGSQESVDPEALAADIVTENATGVEFVRDVYGPWLVMTDDLQGELFIDHDGFVYYRPSNGLGYGIGKMEILDAGATGTAFTLQLESYTYQQTDTVVPQFGLHFDVTGMVKKVTTKSSDYTTFSLVGVWRRWNQNASTEALLSSQKTKVGGLLDGGGGGESDDACIEPNPHRTEEGGRDAVTSSISTGQFNAAKLPLSGAEAALKPFEPNTELQGVFAHVFPEHLRADSHVRRAAQSAAAATGTKDGVAAASVNLGGGTAKAAPTPLLTSKVAHMDLAPYAVGSIPGLYYIPDYISEAEEAQMLQLIRDTPKELRSKLSKRTVQEWGCTMCEDCQKSFVSDANMPPWVQETVDMQVYDGLFTPTTFPNSVRIHEYQQGEGIGPHCDGPIYVPMVTVLSLASSCLMSFYPRQALYENHPMDHYNDTFKFADGEIGQRVPLQSVVLEPRSVLIFSGEGYYHYPHGVSDKAQDDLSSDLVGDVVNRHLLRDKEVQQIPRTFRASITTRNLMTRCSHQPARAEYAMKRAWYLYNHLPVPQPLFAPAPKLPAETLLPGVRTSPSPSSPAKASSAPPPVTETKASRSNEVTIQPSSAFSSSRHSKDHLIAAVEDLKKDQAELRTSVEELKQLMLALVPSQQTFQAETSTVLNHLSSTVLELDGKMDDVLDALDEVKATKKKEEK